MEWPYSSSGFSLVSHVKTIQQLICFFAHDAASRPRFSFVRLVSAWWCLLCVLCRGFGDPTQRTETSRQVSNGADSARADCAGECRQAGAGRPRICRLPMCSLLTRKMFCRDLRSGCIAIPDTVSFDSFTGADTAVLTCAELDDGEIIRQVSAAPPDDDSESEDDAPCATLPSHAERAQAVTVLSAAYSDRTTLSEIQAYLIARKRNSVQRRTHDFFKPTAEPE